MQLEDPDLSTNPIAKVTWDGMTPETEAVFLPSLRKDRDWSTGSCIFWHLHDTEKFLALGDNVLLTTFETDGFTQKELELGEEFDALGSASSWGVEVLRKYFPKKRVFQAPHALAIHEGEEVGAIEPQVGSDPVERWGKVLNGILPKDTLVLTTAGKYEKRKGHPELIGAVARQKDPTLLVCFTHNPFLPTGYACSDAHYEGFESMPAPHGILLFRKKQNFVAFMPRAPERKDLFGALSRSHCFMAPSRGEGWNLPLFEMMSLGMLCAATLNTGHLDYCDKDSVVEIQQGGLAPANDHRFFLGDRGNWYDIAVPEVMKAIDTIRELHSTKQYRIKQLTQNARSSTKKFSWQKSARTLLEITNDCGPRRVGSQAQEA